MVVMAAPELRGPAFEEFLAGNDDGDGCPRGDTQVLQQVDQEDQGTPSS
jgi:hypothetical protein